jgi:hypothetical protein
MSSVTNAPNYEGRIYSSDDVHAAGLVLIDRRDFIRRKVLETYGALIDTTLLVSVCREVEFLMTTNEQMFSDMEAGR